MKQQECFFTKKDVLRLFLRKKKTYQKLFFLAFFLVVCFRLIDPPVYVATALFKQASSEQNQSEILKSFLQNNKGFPTKDSGLQSIFESRLLIRKVVEDLGLTLTVHDRTLLARWLCTAKNRLYSELGLPFLHETPIQFSKASFTGENPSSFFIQFGENDSFEVFDAKKKKLILSRIGSLVSLPEGSFIVSSAKGVSRGRLYKISVTPWVEAVKRVKSHLKVKNNKLEKSIFSLSFSSPYAETSAAILNRLMFFYQKYLAEENEELARVQMEYLDKRQQELLQKYEGSLHEHAAFLERSLDDTGFLHLKQEVCLLEKPSEEYTKRLYDIDLNLLRLQKDIEVASAKYEPKERHFSSPFAVCSQGLSSFREGQELEGLTLENAQKLLLEYSRERDSANATIEQLSQLLSQIFRPDFEISSLSGILTDLVSQEMIQKAAKASLEIKDTANHSVKDLERMQEGLSLQKKFFSQHISQLLSTYKLKLQLLEQKIFSLQKTNAHLLEVEKSLVKDLLASLQEKMRSLPEKWKRENQLTMQRELSIGMVEGLTQLAESKNISHHLFHVESKPIDQAYAPYKAFRGFIWAQGLLAGLFLCGFAFGKDFVRWLSRGRAITEGYIPNDGISFCGFIHENCKESVRQMGSEEKETLRKVSAFISLEKQKRVEKGLCAAIFSSAPSFSAALSALLVDKGLRVLLIECTPDLVETKEGGGLYDFLLGRSDVKVFSDHGFSKIFPGGYEGSFVELLWRKKFMSLVEENVSKYDVVLLSMQAHSLEAAAIPLKELSHVEIIHAQDVFLEELSAKKKTAIALFS
jgi:hypothetical protein